MASRDGDAISKASARIQEKVGGTTFACVVDVRSAEASPGGIERQSEFIRRCRLAECIRANFAQCGSGGPGCGTFDDRCILHHRRYAAGRRRARAERYLSSRGLR